MRRSGKLQHAVLFRCGTTRTPKTEEETHDPEAEPDVHDLQRFPLALFLFLHQIVPNLASFRLFPIPPPVLAQPLRRPAHDTRLPAHHDPVPFRIERDRLTGRVVREHESRREEGSVVRRGREFLSLLLLLLSPVLLHGRVVVAAAALGPTRTRDRLSFPLLLVIAAVAFRLVCSSSSRFQYGPQHFCAHALAEQSLVRFGVVHRERNVSRRLRAAKGESRCLACLCRAQGHRFVIGKDPRSRGCR